MKSSVALVWVWEAALLAIFLAHRGGDVGRLPGLLARLPVSLARGPLVEIRALAETATGALVAASIVCAWYGIGRAIERLGRRALGCADEVDAPPALERARACAIGAGSASLLWFWLGIAGLYRPSSAAVVLSAGLALCVAPARGRTAQPDAAPSAEPRGGTRAAWACLVPAVVFAGVAAAAPPTGKDALIYHLALPKAFVEAGALVAVPDNVPSFYPLGAEMQSVWAMLLGGSASARAGEAAATLVAFAFHVLLLAAVYGWARGLGLDRAWALTAAALVATVPTAYLVASSGYVDQALALHAALALEAAGRWWASGSRRALLHLALALGFALSVKLLAAFIVVPLPLLILLRARRAQASAGGRGAALALGGGALALAVAGLLALPWYGRTWALTGSPLFPLYLDLWPAAAPGWDAHRSRLFQAFLAQYGGDSKSVLDYLAAPLYVSLVAQPELPAHYDGVLGIAFLAGLPFLLRRRRASLAAEASVPAALAALLFLLWLASSEQIRFLLPALPALAVGIVAAAAGTAAERASRGALLAATLAGQVVILAWFVGVAPLRAALGGESRDAYLSRRLEYYPYYRLVNTRLPATAKVWLVDMRRDTYHLARPYVADYHFEDWTLRRWVDEARDAGDVRERARRAGITHILVRHDVLLDPRTSPFEDDARRRIVRSFLAEGTRVLRADARFALVELSPAPAASRGAS